ncbi:MAG: hypothetical protein HOE90_09240 [Bacteriovoracaceae bacterium]|jgi:hypothetical protein|nr:hypothetical protein [Bacteriovoracaceae bacterium]
MCDVCKLTKREKVGTDRRILNTIYSYFGGTTMQLYLCYNHDVDLFKLGERRFFNKFPHIKKDMKFNSEKYISIKEDGFF